MDFWVKTKDAERNLGIPADTLKRNYAKSQALNSSVQVTVNSFLKISLQFLSCNTSNITIIGI